MGSTVTIQLPDHDERVDTTLMLRACAEDIASGRSLAALRGHYLIALLEQIAAAVEDGPPEREQVDVDLGHPSGLAWSVEEDLDGRWLVIGAPAVDTALPGVVLAVEHAEDHDGADASEAAARAVHAAIASAIASAPTMAPPQPAPEVPAAARGQLAALHARIAARRAARAGTPLGRYAAGRELARRGLPLVPAPAQPQDPVQVQAHEDVRDAQALAVLLQALICGDEDGAAELLHGLAEHEPDFVTSLQRCGDTLATLAAHAGSGVR